MSIRRLAGSTALALSLAAPAFADVTPEQVWEDWQAFSAAGGQTITTESVERDGDTLVVTGMKLTFAQDGVNGTGSIDELRFTDNGDGTVGVTLSETYPIEMTIDPPEGEGTDGPLTLAIQISQPGIAITASGTNRKPPMISTPPALPWP